MRLPDKMQTNLQREERGVMTAKSEVLYWKRVTASLSETRLPEVEQASSAATGKTASTEWCVR